jgi:hypothetical protein
LFGGAEDAARVDRNGFDNEEGDGFDRNKVFCFCKHTLMLLLVFIIMIIYLLVEKISKTTIEVFLCNRRM